MQHPQKIRLSGLFDLDSTGFTPGNPDVPIALRDRRDIRLVVFELLSGLDIRSHIAIPVSAGDDDTMIAQARAAVHELLSSLSEETRIWKPTPQEGVGTP